MLKAVITGGESTKTFDRLREVVEEFVGATVADALVAEVKVDAECIHPTSMSKNSLKVTTNGAFFCVEVPAPEVTATMALSASEQELADLEQIVKNRADAIGVDASFLAHSLLVRLSMGTVDSGNTVTDPIVHEGVGYIPDTPARVLMNRIPELGQLVSDLRAIAGVHNVVAMDRGSDVQIVAFVEPFNVDASMEASRVWLAFQAEHGSKAKFHFEPLFLDAEDLSRYERNGYQAL